MSAAEGRFGGGPGVPEDGQEEQDVHHDKHHRVDRASPRVLARDLGLDHQSQEVGEEDHQAPLLVGGVDVGVGVVLVVVGGAVVVVAVVVLLLSILLLTLVSLLLSLLSSFLLVSGLVGVGENGGQRW